MSGTILVIKHTESEGPGRISDFFKDTTRRLQIMDLNMGGKLPADPTDFDAVISLGGPMNVYEEEKYPFLKEENSFLQAALKKSVPILGICLGSQLIAKALGASVKKSPIKEIGWHKVSLTLKGMIDPLFEGLNFWPDVFQWHEDTFDIPENGILLAEAEGCKNQAFRYGKNAYGLQFHMETTPGMIATWLKASGLRPQESGKILSQAIEKNRLFKMQSRKLLYNFSRIINASKKAFVC